MSLIDVLMRTPSHSCDGLTAWARAHGLTHLPRRSSTTVRYFWLRVFALYEALHRPFSLPSHMCGTCEHKPHRVAHQSWQLATPVAWHTHVAHCPFFPCVTDSSWWLYDGCSVCLPGRYRLRSTTCCCPSKATERCWRKSSSPRGAVIRTSLLSN